MAAHRRGATAACATTRELRREGTIIETSAWKVREASDGGAGEASDGGVGEASDGGDAHSPASTSLEPLTPSSAGLGCKYVNAARQSSTIKYGAFKCKVL
jgi:hypothetical protein